MARGVLWKGKYYVAPQAASKVDSSELRQFAFGSDNRLALLAEMVGLIPPKQPYKVSNAAEAFDLIHPSSKEARLAVGLLFDPAPGNEVPGASEVYLVPVNPATQASIVLADAAEAPVVTLKTHLYGLPANQVRTKVESGTTSGKRVTIAYQGEVEVFDNLAKTSFTVQYSGSGSAATMTIDVGARTLTTEVTGAELDSVTLSFDSYPTVQAVIDALSSTGAYIVDAVTLSPETDLSIHLDKVTAQDIKTTAIPVTASLQLLVDTINGRSAYVTATRAAGAGALPESKDWTYLAGGSYGSTGNQDWQDAFDAIKSIDVQIIVPLTPDPSVHAMGDSHCDYMSGPDGKSERRQFVGGALQDWHTAVSRTTAIAALRAAAKALNSDRTLHVGLGCKIFDESGSVGLYPAYLTACAYAGIAAGSTPVEPLTRKFLRVLGLETELQRAEIDTLLEAGLAVPIPAPSGNGYVVSRQVTTWLQSDDLYRIEYSIGRGVDFIARSVRLKHEELIGKPGTEHLDTTIVNMTNGVLQNAKREGYIRDYDPKATQIRVEGTIRYVDYSAIPIMPVNWIFSTYHLKPLSLTIQL